MSGRTKKPQYVDCRPIYVDQSVKDARFEIEYKEKVELLGLPGDIVIGVSPSQTATARATRTIMKI